MLTEAHIRRLASINSIEALLSFLRDELDWPLTSESVEDVTFTYEPEALGLKEEHWPKINAIYQVRRITTDQPWGIFYIDFENKKLPVTILRRILNHLRLKNKGRSGQWDAGDLLFMTTYGEEAEGMREVAFAHFHQQAGDLPTLNVLQWDAQDTPAKLRTTYDTLKGNLGWPPDTGNSEGWREQWRAPFRHKLGHTIKTSKALASALAVLSRSIRDSVNQILEAENDQGRMTKLYKAFKDALLHDLEPDKFADTFAQTVSYGLLIAAFSRTPEEGSGHGTSMRTEDAPALVPPTNPFLKEVLETFIFVAGRNASGVDFDELGIQAVVELLNSPDTDIHAIRRDFGNRKPGEDPVIHFYEDYLAAYDKPERKKRGVFYTPQPVVSYIVRSVHELLQTEFGIEDGLASTITWRELVARGLPHKQESEQTRANPSQPAQTLTIPEGTDPDSHFVVILDPATGTATFLVEVIDVIWKHLRAKWDTDRAGCLALLRSEPIRTNPNQPEQGFLAFWNSYVPDHLLPRLYGYELMMAPYSIAHMKVGLKLAETGYTFSTDKRVRIYLTNALEPASELQARLALDWEALAHEAQAVKAVKETQRFTVVIGNPPYSVSSWNTGDWIAELTECYKTTVRAQESQLQALSNDYIKFLRLGEWQIEQSGYGVLGLITGHGYLHGTQPRDLREHLAGTFAKTCCLDLHGSIRRSGTGADDDEPVFQIMTGVAIIVGTRFPGGPIPGKTSTASLTGPVAVKFSHLSAQTATVIPSGVGWHEPKPTNFFFAATESSSLVSDEFNGFFDLPAAFGTGNRVADKEEFWATGFASQQDDLAMSFSPLEMSKKMADLAEAASFESLVAKYRLCSTNQWSFTKARAYAQGGGWREMMGQVAYRPFDRRWTVLHKNVLTIMRQQVMSQLSDRSDNLALVSSRAVNDLLFAHVFVTREPTDKIFISSKTSTNAYLFPLLFAGHPNLSPAFLDAIAGAIGRRFAFSSSPVESLISSCAGSNAAQPALGDFGSELGSMQGSLADSSPIDPNAPTFTPEDVFHYIYAVLHSPTYRSRYAEFLKIDFPRIPLPGGPDVFYALAPLGAELVALHLMESPRFDQPMTTFRAPSFRSGEEGVGGGEPSGPRVEKVTFTLQTADCELPTPKGTVWIDKAQTVGFQGVPEEVWNFHIGGYQVCEKWLKDRGPKKGNPGRILTPDDISHYHKIVVALSETIRIMKEIDITIDAHGGWPEAFRGA